MFTSDHILICFNSYSMFISENPSPPPPLPAAKFNILGYSSLFLFQKIMLYEVLPSQLSSRPLKRRVIEGKAPPKKRRKKDEWPIFRYFLSRPKRVSKLLTLGLYITFCPDLSMSRNCLFWVFRAVVVVTLGVPFFIYIFIVVEC